MAAPLVSCIIPVFNGERYLREALDSIAAQTHRPIEIIVVDDGSVDGTAAIARSFTAPVRYFRQTNAGPATARNHGLVEATGEHIGFLDADDRWHPEKLERQLRVLDERASVGAVVAHAVMFLADGGSAAHGGRPAGAAIPAYTTCTLLARRRTFDQVGPFRADLKHSDDTEWFLRARAQHIEIEMVPDVLLYRRLHADNISRRERSDSFDEYLRLIKSNLDHRRRQDGRSSDPPTS